MAQENNETTLLRSYRRKLLAAGAGILLLSFLVGIGISFAQWDRGSPFNVSQWDDYNPLGRASYGPFIFALYLFPLTFLVLLILSLPIYFGLKKRGRWPFPLLGFVAMGVLWIFWMTALWDLD